MTYTTIYNLKVPLYSNIINFGLDSFEKTAKRIDLIENDEKEWEKINILVNDVNYLWFLKKITNTSEEEIVKYFNEFYNDTKFRKNFSKKLKIIESDKSIVPGDLRFHSISLYVILRAIKPEVVVETDVAFGKSTSLMLLALEHNEKGKLYSVDLPNKEDNIMGDGAKTSTGIYGTGFLVPDYLKKNWILKIGNSLKCLPEITKKVNHIDVFLHDSLHTYDHVNSELKIIYPKMKKGSVILCDNIDKDSGLAFNDFLNENKLVGFAYRDFGGVYIHEK